MIWTASRALILGALAGAAACSGQGTSGQRSQPAATADDQAKGTTEMTTTAHSWKVYDKSELILEVSDAPGPILSTAAPPPGLKPATHPFLSASARSARHEHRLRELLTASTSVDDFLARLRKAGYEVRPDAAP